MKYSIYILLLLSVACKSKERVLVENRPDATQPSWLLERPVTGFDYIGIGVGNTASADYRETAKKNALNDLASEISVNIEGNSLLYTLDRNYKFEEEFTSTIQATTSERLEGFELVDSWSDDNEYWVYYRLSKAEHARLKAERKERAMAKAKDLALRGDASLKAGNIKEAFQSTVNALLAFKDYWNEEDRTMLNGEEVLLGNHLYARLQAMTANINLNVLPQRAVLELANDFERELRIAPEYEDATGAVALKQLPLLVHYPRDGRVQQKRLSTGANGEAFFLVKDIDFGNEKDVRISVDVQALASSINDRMVTPLLAALTSVEAVVPLEVKMPRIHLRADERNYGKPLQVVGVASILKQEMSKRGFVFTSLEDAELYVDLKANTRKGGVMQDFHTAYLDLEILFERADNGQVIHQTADKEVKGVQLTWRKAGEEAFRKGGEAMKKRIVPAMINALL